MSFMSVLAIMAISSVNGECHIVSADRIIDEEIAYLIDNLVALRNKRQEITECLEIDVQLVEEINVKSKVATYNWQIMYELNMRWDSCQIDHSQALNSMRIDSDWVQRIQRGIPATEIQNAIIGLITEKTEQWSAELIRLSNDESQREIMACSEVQCTIDLSIITTSNRNQ